MMTTDASKYPPQSSCTTVTKHKQAPRHQVCGIRCSADRNIASFASNRLKGGEAHPLAADASDDALIKAIGQRDRHAMAVLYGRHHVRVYRFALRVTGDATLAEDIVSDVFLEVWRHADRFKSKAQVSTWLLAIARNKSITAVRRHCDEHLEVNALEIEDPADDPEALISKSDPRRAIQRALLQLSAAQREVIDLVYYHEKSVGEVATIIGVPAGTVKSRMFYARRRMKAVIETAERNGFFGAVGPRKNGKNNSRQAGPGRSADPARSEA
jgi:RNA polymerase sigma-70 factor (ECF subfamily)